MFATVTLARWLGPWADATKAPRVAVADEHLDELRVRIYGDRTRHRAAYLVAPGLHYAGPDDPRMDRFCRILAAAGHVVIAPFIPSYLALVPDDAAKRDFARVFDARARWTRRRPIVFSISFGSLLAFALAAERGADIDRLVIFGGYRDLPETLKFCLTGAVEGGRAATRDPLNQPVVLLNLLAHVRPAVSADDRAAIAEAWRGYVRRTWGRMELKADRRFVAVAEELAPAVPPHLRELFLVGIGALPGADTLAMDALTRFDGAALDPTPYLARIANRVDLVHGADDDVIPFEHSHALALRLTSTRARVHITGMYGHTGAHAPRLSAMAAELATMLRVLRILAA
ncbi:MAG: hypothetical protein KF773_41000 [Deltaproteobacteria bacterium]|nr:hypothetical protein [Deltaproteobacteria bacterium]